MNIFQFAIVLQITHFNNQFVGWSIANLNKNQYPIREMKLSRSFLISFFNLFPSHRNDPKKEEEDRKASQINSKWKFERWSRRTETSVKFCSCVLCTHAIGLWLWIYIHRTYFLYFFALNEQKNIFFFLHSFPKICDWLKSWSDFPMKKAKTTCVYVLYVCVDGLRDVVLWLQCQKLDLFYVCGEEKNFQTFNQLIHILELKSIAHRHLRLCGKGERPTNCVFLCVYMLLVWLWNILSVQRFLYNQYALHSTKATKRIIKDTRANITIYAFVKR